MNSIKLPTTIPKANTLYPNSFLKKNKNIRTTKDVIIGYIEEKENNPFTSNSPPNKEERDQNNIQGSII